MCRFAQSLLCKVTDFFGPFEFDNRTSWHQFDITNCAESNTQYTWYCYVESSSDGRVGFVSGDNYSLGTTLKVTPGAVSGSFTTRDNIIKASLYYVKVKSMYITKASNDKKIYIIPTIIKNLGESVSGIIFGLNSNGNFMGGFMYGLSGSATTGNITLGNAVGYITVNFNGQIVKIPYYNE